ncbi:MAG: hypothetical protein AUK48_10890 [Oscillatoriales cyanobacterium CG2_30_44_21]|nr:MAG: hypothetical protein AUK48_10890 [Oscillatoriales cyanobacterium CG2_30_44_21]
MNTPLVIGALLVSVLIFWWLLSVIKASLKTALLVVVVVFALQVFTGIGPQQIFNQVGQWMGISFNRFGAWLQNWGNKNKFDPDVKKQSLLMIMSILIDQ